MWRYRKQNKSDIRNHYKQKTSCQKQPDNIRSRCPFHQFFHPLDQSKSKRYICTLFYTNVLRINSGTMQGEVLKTSHQIIQISLLERFQGTCKDSWWSVDCPRHLHIPILQATPQFFAGLFEKLEKRQFPLLHCKVQPELGVPR